MFIGTQNFLDFTFAFLSEWKESLTISKYHESMSSNLYDVYFWKDVKKDIKSGK